MSARRYGQRYAIHGVMSRSNRVILSVRQMSRVRRARAEVTAAGTEVEWGMVVPRARRDRSAVASRQVAALRSMVRV